MPASALGSGRVLPMTAHLRDGSQVRIRAVHEHDREALGEFLCSLSLEARRLRFFTGGVDIGKIAAAVGAVGPDRLGLVAIDAADEIVGHTLAIALDDRSAEVAVEVADELHEKGLGTILLERLAQLAERRGVERLVAEVLPENRAMLEVFRDGFDAVVRSEDGVDGVEFSTRAWRAARRRFPS